MNTIEFQINGVDDSGTVTFQWFPGAAHRDHVDILIGDEAVSIRVVDLEALNRLIYQARQAVGSK